MKTLSELINELKTLPMGNVYKKTINGKQYYYHQYFINGARVGSIVSKDKVKELIEKIEYRKQIEKQIKLIKSKQKNVTLSKNAKELTGSVMSGNTVVATFEQGTLTYINKKLAPLVIKRTHRMEEFLKLRVIDMSRTNARILKRILNIHTDDDYKVALYSYALSVNDNYWFRPKHSKAKYQELKFKDDSYFDTALKGDTTPSRFISQLTPEITTTGSFEKGWKYINGEWWLYKSGKPNQIFAELYSYHFAKLIGIDTAIYEYDDGYIRSKNFATRYNFEPMASLLGDNDDNVVIFDELYKISKDIAKDYLKLIAFDAVVFNVDRHNENVGILRDRRTGKIVSLAPNFDNNMAFYSNSEITLNMPQKDQMIKLFANFLNKNEIAKELYQEIVFPVVTIKDLRDILSKVEIKINNEEEVVATLLARYKYVKSLFNTQHN